MKGGRCRYSCAALHLAVSECTQGPPVVACHGSLCLITAGLCNLAAEQAAAWPRQRNRKLPSGQKHPQLATPTANRLTLVEKRLRPLVHRVPSPSEPNLLPLPRCTAAMDHRPQAWGRVRVPSLPPSRRALPTLADSPPFLPAQRRRLRRIRRLVHAVQWPQAVHPAAHRHGHLGRRHQVQGRRRRGRR